MPEPFFDTSQISDRRAPTPSRLRLRPASLTALQYQRVRHKHCCSGIARLPPRGPSFACSGVRRQPPLARLMQQLAEQQARREFSFALLSPFWFVENRGLRLRVYALKIGDPFVASTNFTVMNLNLAAAWQPKPKVTDTLSGRE